MTDAQVFRIVPASDRYVGLTALPLANGKELVALGVGPEVEVVLIRTRELAHKAERA